MFERFTEQARRVLVLAAREARLAGHGRIDIGDLLAGLAGESAGLASAALRQCGADASVISGANLTTPGAIGEPTLEDDAMAVDTKAALQAAAEHAVADGHADVGTAHLLLGVLDQPSSRAHDMLAALGVPEVQLRHVILELLDDGQRDGDAPRAAVAVTPSRVVPILLDRWAAVLDPTGQERLRALEPALKDAERAADATRQWLLADWLVRTATPAWLRAAGLEQPASLLDALAAIDGATSAQQAGTALDAATMAMAETVPGAIAEAERPGLAAALQRLRERSGELATAQAIVVDLPSAVIHAADDTVTRMLAKLVLRDAAGEVTGVWGPAFAAARRAVEEDQRGGGRRPGQRAGGDAARRMAMRAARVAAGPAALPLSLLEAGVRNARARRARERLDGRAGRAALVACCRQLVADAGWVVAGDGAIAPTGAEVAGRLQASLLDLLPQLSG